MALYEYQCQQCGTRSEVLQKMADPPLTVCELCGGPLKRLLSSPAVQFKGSGWYVTDYARKSGGAPSGGSKGDGGDSKAEPSKSEAKGGGESKAAGGDGSSGSASASASPGGSGSGGAGSSGSGSSDG